jgi:hypothetical protein
VFVGSWRPVPTAPREKLRMEYVRAPVSGTYLTAGARVGSKKPSRGLEVSVDICTCNCVECLLDIVPEPWLVAVECWIAR